MTVTELLYAIRTKLESAFFRPVHIAPLVIFRITFGGVMFFSTIRFFLKGWIEAFYIKPVFHFTYYGFGWVKPLGGTGMYFVFGLLLLSSAFITLGFCYRVAVITFFLCFTYIELIDKTTYLNHYYLISLLAFLLIFVPAGGYFSIDTWRKPKLKVDFLPGWCVNIFRLQLILVYFFAGISKINYDWLLTALPLRIWLPAQNHLPVIGKLLNDLWVAYAFSWVGMLFDLCIGFLLIFAVTRKAAYVFVVIFHLVTGWLFNIGVFPYVMIFLTIIFFSDRTHLKIISLLKRVLSIKTDKEPILSLRLYRASKSLNMAFSVILVTYFCIQLVLPLRYLLYPGKLYWTEEGFRFSWRVMLMEKGGTAFFYVKNPDNGLSTEVINSQYLSSFQEKMMATQPDMILEYSQFLTEQFRKKGVKDPVVTVESFATLNGSGSRPFIDRNVDLSKERESFNHKNWIIPF